MAMRNPDWRRKGGGSAVNNSESANTDPLSIETAPERHKPEYAEHVQHRHAHKSPSGPEHCDLSSSPSFYAVRQPSHSEVKSTCDTTRSPRYTSWQGQDDMQDDEARFLCELMSHKALPSPDARPLSLMEVRRPGKADSKNDHSHFVELKPAPLDSHKRLWHRQDVSPDAQSEQFHAALQAVDTTPYRMRPAKRPAIIPNVTFTDPASEKHAGHAPVYSDVNSRSREGTESSFGGWGQFSSDPPTLPSYAHQSPGMPRRGNGSTLDSGWGSVRFSETMHHHTVRDDKYAKMLEKLHGKGPKQHTSAHGQPHDARMTNSDDSGYASMRKGDNYTLSSLADSTGLTTKESENLNPKAREFLSFSLKKEQQQRKEQEESLRSFRPMPIKELFVKDSQTRETSADKALDPVNFIDPGAALTSQHPFNASLPMMAMAAANGLYRNMGSPGPAFNATPFQFPNYNATWAPGQMPYNFPTPNPFNRMNWLAGLSSPLTSPIQPGPPTNFTPPALHTMNPTAPAFSNPAPVPKPRRPDPSDQQAYEAYIEWRKANEPGYAAQCKLRQQRRSQRNVAKVRITRPPEAVPAGKTSPPVTKDEPSTVVPEATSV
ncbi:uncharacterized protein F5Z01DRAFT_662039 [Emericellopsis atlantica]|uniref:Uncharacterized protein n=1 Tax=Emericellopsis atlantica TaxID=2614577 RepID=A0A9P7ZHY0_9HYPO|nr:uncharacterized protein F5Z01DRAFT_662039 [Emericellopsis atlantica]KAG9252127.1 hypothetical protein F5Z01DRAFT_662039 [Emericellopsis atlantica]